MLTKRDRAAKYEAIEELRQTRVDNLRELAKQYGSWSELARQCAHSVTFLIACAGPNPRRNIGEVLARDIERMLRLKAGYLDVKH